MLRFNADAELVELIRRYYQGEAGLWNAICQCVDTEVRQRRGGQGAFHFRLRKTDAGYDVLVEGADAYLVGEH